MDKSDKMFLVILSLLVLVVIVATYYRFMVQKDYDFYVEAPCDPASSTCFARDCSEPDSCPPNGLETYKAFYVNAGDFEKCADNSCLNECSTGLIECTEFVCGESEEDECSEPGIGLPEEEGPVFEDGTITETVEEPGITE